MKMPSSIITAIILATFFAGQNRAPAAATRVRGDGGESLVALAFGGKIEVVTVGTGRSIGHVADLRMRNPGQLATFLPAVTALHAGSNGKAA